MFQYKDFLGNASVDQSIDPEEYTTAQNGTGVDCLGADGVAVVFTVGAATNPATANHFNLKVQHSDDNTTFADVGAGDLVGADGSKLTGAEVVSVDAATKDDQAYTVSYLNSKRYVRAAATETGTATLNFGAVIVRYRKQYP